MGDLNPTAAAVLAHLRQGPDTGWGVSRGLEATVGPFWNVTQSQVYRELGALAEAGLVEGSTERGRRARREFSLTAAGETAFLRWLGEPPGTDVVRIPLLLKLAIGGGDLSDETLCSFAASQREQHQECLAGYLAIVRELEATAPRQALLVRYGIHHERAVLAWLDTLAEAVDPSRASF